MNQIGGWGYEAAHVRAPQPYFVSVTADQDQDQDRQDPRRCTQHWTKIKIHPLSATVITTKTVMMMDRIAK